MGLFDSNSSSSQSAEATEGTFASADYGNSDVAGMLNGNGLADEIQLQDSTIGTRLDGYKSNIKFNDNSTSISTYELVDHGAVRGAFDFAKDAFGVNASTIDNLIVAGSELTFAGFEAVRDFADLSDRSSERNAEFAESLFSQGLNFADEQAYRAVETANISAQLVGDAWYSANNSIMAITGDSIAAVERGVTDANVRATNSIERANDNALSSILAVVAGSNASIDQTNADALQYVSEAQKTESERTTDTLLKWGIGGMALVAAAFSLRK